MKVNEIFLSVQGEGMESGYLTIFLRLSGCNLRCFFCDTTYAYNEGEEISEEEIFKKIKSFGIKNLCISGGEPMLQGGVIPLIKKLLKENYKITIMTNGTRNLRNLPLEVVKIVDIKTPSSQKEGRKGEKLFLNKNLKYLTKKDEIKFVISTKEDFIWAMDFIEKEKLFDKVQTIHLSPCHGILNPQELIEWMKEKKAPMRLNLQIHKYIYGDNVRGK